MVTVKKNNKVMLEIKKTLEQKQRMSLMGILVNWNISRLSILAPKKRTSELDGMSIETSKIEKQRGNSLVGKKYNRLSKNSGATKKEKQILMGIPEREERERNRRNI